MLMYIVTSFMMIHHEWFKVDRNIGSPITIQVKPENISVEHWDDFLSQNNIEGRMTREDVSKSGEIVRTYSSARGNSKITISPDKNSVEISTTKLNRSGHIIGLHRMRGYGGPMIYNLYAFLLDLTGISLILFAVTGVILWFKLLKNSIIAWLILILGFFYVAAIIGYLVSV